MRFHILGLAHVPAIPERSTCAYSQKTLRLSRMLIELGHEVYFYGVEGSAPQCTEFFPVVSEAVLQETYGGYDWDKEQYRHDPSDLAYSIFDDNATAQLEKCGLPGDYLLCCFGNYQRHVIERTAHLGMTAVEPGVGYMGVVTQFRVFESYAWMHYVYGLEKRDFGQFYDSVIPNCYDPSEFSVGEETGKYLLMLTRMIESKGIRLAIEIANLSRIPLIIAGQGNIEEFGGESKFVEHVGAVGPGERRELLKGARALLCPTYYIGPFEGVTTEAAFSGVPSITTDFGCFSETVIDGITGFRCHTMAEFLQAVDFAPQLHKDTILHWATENFSLKRGKALYQQYFENLNDVIQGKGFYEKHTRTDGYLTRGNML